MAIPLEKRKTVLGTTGKGTGTYNPTSNPLPPVPKTYQEIIAIGQNTLIQKLNDYPYIERRNDILQLGDSRGRSEKYPPESLLHMTGGSGYAGRGFDDGFVRGGIVLSTAVALEDTLRVGNFLSSTKGLLWTLREQGLQLTNPRPETRLFNPVSLLLQTAGGHLGLHLPRHGLNPFNLGSGQLLDFGYNTYSTAKDYEAGGNSYTVTPFIAVPRQQPKLLDMASEMFLGDKSLNLTKGAKSLLDLFGNVGLGTNVAGYVSPRDSAGGGPEISTISYLAAANSPYGGFSLFGNGMHRSVNTLLDSDGNGLQQTSFARNGDGGFRQLKDMATFNYRAPVTQLVGLVKGAVGGLISKVPAPTGLKVPGGTSQPSPNPDALKVYKTLSYGELGQNAALYVSSERDTLEGPSKNYAIYPKIAAGGRVPSKRSNMMTNRGFSDPGNAVGTTFDRTNSQALIKGEVSLNPHDLVPLIFYDVKNDETLVFRAVLSGITDTLSPEWNEYNYIGNPQTYYTYKRTTRDFGFTFKIYTDSERELRWNWMKLNRFVGMVYPSFNDANRMIGPFLKITLADMLNNVSGYISALTITVDDMTPWEINLFDNEQLAKVPHVVECAVTYRIIGDRLDARTTKFYAQNKMRGSNWSFDNWDGVGGLAPAVPAQTFGNNPAPIGGPFG